MLETPIIISWDKPPINSQVDLKLRGWSVLEKALRTAWGGVVDPIVFCGFPFSLGVCRNFLRIDFPIIFSTGIVVQQSDSDS